MPEEPTEPPGILYHYTNSDGLKGIIGSRTFWATEIRHLNDTSELRYPRKKLLAAVESLRAARDVHWSTDTIEELIASWANTERGPETFVASFCSDGDNLSQWRGYGDGGNGFAIGLDREALAMATRAQGYNLVRLMYEGSEQEALLTEAVRDAVPILDEWARDPDSAPNAAMQLLLLSFGFLHALVFLKNPYFHDEREWRLTRIVLPEEPVRRGTHLREGENIPHEIVDLAEGSSIREIVVGPTPKSATVVEDVGTLLRRSGLGHVAIRASQAPLR